MKAGRLRVLALALALDLAFGELPNAVHPVALFGRGMGLLERRLGREGAGIGAGLAYAAAGAGTGLAAGLALKRTVRWRGPAGTLLTAVALKQTFALRGLLEHVAAVERPLAAWDLVGAKAAVGRIVGRPTEELDEGLVASAAVESLFENLSDGVVGAWWWYAVGGLPAALAYRAANTMDAMVGYPWRGRFGTPAARLDDALNFAPARLTAAALAIAGGVGPGAVREAVREARGLRSPNAGWPMATGARALGVRLEKVGKYVLNPAGRVPGPGDIGRGRSLACAAAGVAFLACSGLLVWRDRK